MGLKVIKYLASLALLGSAVGVLQADSFTRTYTGSLSSSAAVVQETFSLSSPSDLLVTTTSYGGGTNLDGSVAGAGGFQPSVTLYTAAGNYVASQLAGSPIAKTDPSTGLALDAYLSRLDLLAGSYILTLTDWETQQPPTATNLSDGFVRYGGTTLMDVGGNTRNATYALNISATSSAAAVPEPATLGFLLVALSGLLLWTRKYSQSHSSDTIHGGPSSK